MLDYEDTAPVPEAVLAPLQQPVVARKEDEKEWTMETYVSAIPLLLNALDAHLFLRHLTVTIAQFAAPAMHWNVQINDADIQYQDDGYTAKRVRGDRDIYIARLECPVLRNGTALYHVRVNSKSDEMWIGLISKHAPDYFDEGMMFMPGHASYYGGRAAAGIELLAKKAALFESELNIPNLRLHDQDKYGAVHGWHPTQDHYHRLPVYGTGDTVSILYDGGRMMMSVFLNTVWQFSGPIIDVHGPLYLFAALDECGDSVTVTCDDALLCPPVWVRKYLVARLFL